MNHIYNDKRFGENWFSYGPLYSAIVNSAPNNAHFVELGSWKGKSAAYMAVEIINSGKNIKFDCVDAWSYTPYVPNQAILGDDLYNIFIENIKPVSHIIKVVRDTTVGAASNYKDQSLDFVYVDADHSHDAVVADIEKWLPKVKVNGVLAGHDYKSRKSVKSACESVFGPGNYSDPFNTNSWYIKLTPEFITNIYA